MEDFHEVNEDGTRCKLCPP